MADNNAGNVSTGKPKTTGAVFTAPAGTAAPADGTTPLDQAYVNLGYIGEDGVTNGTEADSEDIVAWGGDTVMSVQTSHSETYQFVCIETNVQTLKEYYGADNVTEADGNITVKSRSGDLPAHPWVFEMLMNGGRIQRIVIPNGKLSERGEIVYVGGEPIGYDMTVSALPDGSGVKTYRYIVTPVASTLI